MPHLLLYQPDIPQNLGAILRLAACFGADLHIVEPCGFPLDDRRIRRAGMDYAQHVNLVRHPSWEAFEAACLGRKVLLTTKASASLYETVFQPDDVLIFGRESAGVPDSVQEASDLNVHIPMQSGMRSLNVAMSAAIALSEAVRQISLIP